MWLFFNIFSPAVRTLLPSLLQRLHSRGIEALILILKKVLNCRMILPHRSDTASQPSVFSCWGTEKSQMMPNQNVEGDQPVQSRSYAQQPWQPQTCVQEHCPVENRPPFVCFPGSLKNVSGTTFRSPELLIQCGFIWKETMQLASGEVEFNA